MVLDTAERARYAGTMDPVARPLRALKQRRTREAILDAAMALFAEHGFDGVTISDIAARAEVGRTTFFRYFTDKQELLFADDEEILHAVRQSIDAAARPVAPIGESLDDALRVTRAALLAISRLNARHPAWLPVRDRLIRNNPALAARNLLKERHYMQTAAGLLVQHGATAETAALAAGVAAACYWAAQTATADAPERLAPAFDAAFRRIADLGHVTMPD
jgi:AcrR family transcriptional regulator